MAYSYNEVGAVSPGQGIAVPFKFIDRDHVSVLVDGVVTDKYSWLNNGMLQATVGFPSGQVTRVERNTPVAILQAVLEGTAVFDFEGTNNNFSLLLFVLQEYADKETTRNELVQELFEGFDLVAEAVQEAKDAADRAADEAAQSALATIQSVINQIQQTATAAQLAADNATLAAESASLLAQQAAESAEQAASFDPDFYYKKTETYAKSETYSKAETYTKSETDTAIAAAGVPIGASIYWNSPTLPNGFLKENGAAISRTVYPELFAKIGITFGAGDGSTTFNLPDSRAEFIRGLDDGRGVDAGRTLGSWQASQNLSHTHTGTTDTQGWHGHTGSTTASGDHAHTVPTSGNDGGGTMADAATGGATGSASTGAAGNHAHSLYIDGNGNHAHNLSIAASGGAEARPRNVAKLVLIRAF